MYYSKEFLCLEIFGNEFLVNFEKCGNMLVILRLSEF